MGCYRKFIYCHRHLRLLFSFLIVSSSTNLRFMAEGRPLSKFVVTSKNLDDEKLIIRTQIGSRPPRCERRCSSCTHCEAVQVPAIPQQKSHIKHSSTADILNSRGDYSSNYKPMSWKCKCGDRIFNP